MANITLDAFNPTFHKVLGLSHSFGGGKKLFVTFDPADHRRPPGSRETCELSLAPFNPPPRRYTCKGIRAKGPLCDKDAPFRG